MKHIFQGYFWGKIRNLDADQAFEGALSSYRGE